MSDSLQPVQVGASYVVDRYDACISFFIHTPCSTCYFVPRMYSCFGECRCRWCACIIRVTTTCSLRIQDIPAHAKPLRLPSVQAIYDPWPWPWYAGVVVQGQGYFQFRRQATSRETEERALRPQCRVQIALLSAATPHPYTD
jgi:hypothetical protein